jgi:hypothetical protein
VCAPDREYASLRDIVDGNASVLRRPAPGGLKNCKYFHGILSFPETEALLQGKPVRVMPVISHVDARVLRRWSCVRSLDRF